jgi:hypothetical protein
MGILAIVIATISESFWIIICHRSNSYSESFCVCLYLLFFIHPFNVVFLLVYLYLVVNLSNESDFSILPTKTGTEIRLYLLLKTGPRTQFPIPKTGTQTVLI